MTKPAVIFDQQDEVQMQDVVHPQLAIVDTDVPADATIRTLSVVEKPQDAADDVDDLWDNVPI